MRPHRVLIGGLPYFGRMLAELLDGDGWQVRYLESAGLRPGAWLKTARALRSADLVYLIGGQVGRWSRPDWLARLGRPPIVMHWVGSDVTYARAAAGAGRVSPALVSRPEHWAEVPWIADELRPIGVQAAVVPLTSTRMPAEPAPLPRDFTVLTYLPAARPDFYGRPAIARIAAALPNVRLLVAGSEETDRGMPANVEFLGWRREMAPVYAQSTVLVRLTEHDGLSFMVLEALAAGRYVVWNHAIEGAIAVSHPDEAVAALSDLLLLQQAGRLTPNDRGRTAVQEHYDPVRVRGEMRARFGAIIDLNPSRGRPRSRATPP